MGVREEEGEGTLSHVKRFVQSQPPPNTLPDGTAVCTPAPVSSRPLPRQPSAPARRHYFKIDKHFKEHKFRTISELSLIHI